MKKASKIAFLIAAHQDVALLLRLCNLLRDHAVFLHIDAKAVDFPLAKFQSLHHVTTIQPRRSVHWADFSQVEATLDMLRAATMSDIVFDKYVLLSGACYPVKPLTTLAKTFADDGGKNYIRFTKIEPDSTLQNLIGRRWRMTPLVKMYKLGKGHTLVKAEGFARAVVNKIASAFPRDFEAEIGMPAYFGSNWWALSDQAVRYILTKIDKNPQLTYPFRSVYAVDEIFFHTLLASSPYFGQSEGIQKDESARTNQRAPLHLIHPSHERIFGRSVDDFKLARDTTQFFIRKVSSKDSDALLNRIDSELLS
jgi:hypothetical protein